MFKVQRDLGPTNEMYVVYERCRPSPSPPRSSSFASFTRTVLVHDFVEIRTQYLAKHGRSKVHR